jgi:hypothetical protein
MTSQNNRTAILASLSLSSSIFTKFASSATCAPGSCCSQRPIGRRPSWCSQAWPSASPARSPPVRVPGGACCSMKTISCWIRAKCSRMVPKCMHLQGVPWRGCSGWWPLGGRRSGTSPALETRWGISSENRLSVVCWNGVSCKTMRTDHWFSVWSSPISYLPLSFQLNPWCSAQPRAPGQEWLVQQGASPWHLLVGSPHLNSVFFTNYLLSFINYILFMTCATTSPFSEQIKRG